jgi:hypothetical protein
MITTNGKFLTETIQSLGLIDDARTQAIQSAERIVGKIVSSYNEVIGTGHVGATGTGVPSAFSSAGTGAIGLVYGRIQSGKTRAMITSTAMAFDNGFRIAVVMTSNINDLVSQTHLDFSKDLKGVSVYTKDDELDMQIEDAKLDMEGAEGRILIIASKGNKSLQNITRFLKEIEAQNFPLVIFDDEGDQASLDTNTYKRSSTGDLSLQPSTINKLILKLRKDFPASVYVSVTGTPQAVLLQSASSNNRPSFVEILAHGDSYVGGNHFFNTEDPIENEHGLISIIPNEDKNKLLNVRQPFPEGLRNSILFFLLSGSAAIRSLGLPAKGYQFLCHPSLKNSEQDQAANRISIFLTDVKKVLMGKADEKGILPAMETQYAELKDQLGAAETPSLDELKKTIQDELKRKKILIINSQNTKRRGIEYGPGFNFLIGGNTLGRGIAVPNLLVTYYVRIAVVSQIDTMYQHARMFGYRMNTIKYTRLFTTNILYSRFRDIHYSDSALRGFIANHTAGITYPVEFSNGLRATRKNVLNINTTETVWPGKQLYPNYIKLPQAKRTHDQVMQLVATELGASVGDIKDMESKGQKGATISPAKAIEIIKIIKTKSRNAWHDSTINEVIEKLADRLGQNIVLKFRTADRKIGEGGFLETGTISGTEFDQGKANNIPTLWIMSVKAKAGSVIAEGETFVYPTIIVPNSLPYVFVYNKK